MFKICSFKTTTTSQSRNCSKSVLSRPPHCPKVETVQNQFLSFCVPQHWPKITFDHGCIHVSMSHWLWELPSLFLKLKKGDLKADEVVKLMSVKCTALDFFHILATSAACVALNTEACKMTRTDFEQFLLWEDVVVFKELILNSF